VGRVYRILRNFYQKLLRLIRQSIQAEEKLDGCVSKPENAAFFLRQVCVPGGRRR
jgi:hypothetical protein